MYSTKISGCHTPSPIHNQGLTSSDFFASIGIFIKNPSFSRTASFYPNSTQLFHKKLLANLIRPQFIVAKQRWATQTSTRNDQINIRLLRSATFVARRDAWYQLRSNQRLGVLRGMADLHRLPYHYRFPSKPHNPQPNQVTYMRSFIAIATSFAVAATTLALAQDNNYDRQAFLIARKAAVVKTWDDAIALLDTIKIEQLNDEETLSYIVFSKKCASVASQLGVSRESDPNSTSDVASKVDWAQLGVALLKAVQKKGIGDTFQLALDAKKIQDRIPWYLTTDEKLAKKYGVK